MAAFLLAQSMPLPAADGPVHTLANDLLSVEVMDPVSPARYYQGVRFSPVANVMQVSRAGKTYLFAPTVHDSLTEAAGLPQEFDLTSPSEPPGFAEAHEGEGFLKIGVGVLEKTGDIYRFFTPYKVKALAETKVQWFKDRAVFQQQCSGENGYAYRLDAEVLLRGDTVAITYHLQNLGTKAFRTEQYVHNFICLGGLPIEPGYEMALPYDFTTRIPKPVFEVSGRLIKLTGEITAKMKAAEVFISPQGENRTADSASIRYRPSGLALETAVTLPADRITLHASGRYFCPEQFVTISLAPGESKEWTRTYRFTTETP